MVFSLVFQRDFVFDEYAGVTKRPSAENIQVGMFDYSFLCISKIHFYVCHVVKKDVIESKYHPNHFISSFSCSLHFLYDLTE